MTFILVASGVSLAMGIGLVCLIVTRRDAFIRAGTTEPDPILLPEFRPGGNEGRPTRSSRP